MVFARASKPLAVAGFSPADVPKVASVSQLKSTGAMLERLRTRPQFLRVAAENLKWAAPGVVLQAAPRVEKSQCKETGLRYGLTVSKKVGNSVVRNKARRRLRAAAEEILPRCAKTTFDYVLIGRKETPTRKFDELKKDIEKSLHKLDLFQT